MESTIAFSSITLPLSSLIQVIFLVILLVVVIYSVVLYYHWEQYAIDRRVKNLTYAAFGLFTIPLLCIMGFLSLIL